MTDEQKRAATIAAVLVVVAAGAFSAGRFSAPLRVEEKIVERVVFKDKVVEKVVEKIVKVETEARVETKTVYVDRVVTKEGEVRERIIYMTKEVDETKRDTSSEIDKDLVATHEGESSKDSTKTVTLQPAWRVGALVGASLRDPLLPLAGPLVVGLQVEHRILGGVSAGAWVNTVGAAGAVVSFEF